MKHPTPEEWMSYLYREVAPGQRADFDAHLQNCIDCRVRVRTWRDAMSALDQGTMPAVPASRAVQPLLPWAAAAAIVLLAGFGIGRFTAPAAAEARALNASLHAEFRQQLAAARTEMAGELRQQQAEVLKRLVSAAGESAGNETRRLLADFGKSYEEKQSVDNLAIDAALRKLDARWTANHEQLRKELETVAVLTEDSFANTQQQLFQLAGFTQATDPR